MFLVKAGFFLLLSGSIFTVSAYSTVQINKVINRNPVAYNPSENPAEEKDESHQALFAEKLTTFGNLNAVIDVDIQNGNETYTIDGNVFVSLETLSNPEIYMNIDASLYQKNISLEATFKKGIIYTNINDTKLKLSTSDIGDVMNLFTTLMGTNNGEESPLSNIDTMELLNRLSKMTAEEDGDKVIYRCDLLDNFPTIIFTSDKDHNFTGLSLDEINLGGLTISLNASVEVLGNNHNQVKVPEDANEYIDAKSFLNIAKQINNYLEKPQFDINYSVEAYQNDTKLIALEGNGALDLVEGIAFDVNANISSDYVSNEYDINLGYQDHKAYFGLGDIKGYLDDTRFEEVASKLSSLIPSDTISSLLNATDSISLPVLDLIKANDIESILNKYHGIELTNNSLSLTLSNSLLSDNDSFVNLYIELGDDGLKKIKIDNLAYNEYHFNINLELNKFNGLEEKDFSTYFNASNYLNIFDQVTNILENKRFGFNYLVNIDSFSIDGHVNADINNLAFDVNGNVGNGDNSATYFAKYDNGNIFINYQNIIKLMLDKNNLNNIINELKSYVDLSSYTNIEINVDELIDEIKNNYLVNLSNLIINDEGLSFNYEDASIAFKVNEKGLESINLSSLNLFDKNISLKLELTEYQEEEVNENEYVHLDFISSFINKVKEVINNKEIAFDINIVKDELSAEGSLQVKLTDEDFYFSIDVNILDKDNEYHVLLEKDADNYYLIFNDHRFYISLDSINSIVNDIKGLFTDENSALYHYLDDFSFNFDNINILDNIFNLPITNMNEDENGIHITLNNGDTLSVKFNDTNKLSSICFIYNDLEGSLSFKEYENKEHRPYAGWVGANDISNGVHYFAELSKENQIALVEQIKGYTDVNNLSLGVDFDINVTRDNKLTFNTAGNIDVSNTINGLKVNLNGNMVNNENEDKLNTFFDISYLNDTIYFNYNNSLKISYEKSAINDLIEIITTRLPSTTGLEDILGKLLPDISTLSSPLFTAISSNDYLDIFEYFKGCYKENNNLVIVFDAAILGDIKGDLIFSLDASNNGLRHIAINNIYAFGYVLNFDLTIRDYQDFSINTEGFTTLNYMNNIIDTLADLIESKQYAFALNGSIISGSKNISFSGSTQFTLGDFLDRGIGKITITENSKNHNIIIDVTREKVGKDASEKEKKAALKNSDVLFSYNNNLKGSFNLGSLSETYDTILSLVDGNKRVNKYKDLLTADFSKSVINEILNGNIEAILYQNLINNISRSGNNYVIEIDGSFLKKNADIDASNLFLTIRCDASNKLQGISFNGTLLGIEINLNLSLTTYSTSYTGLTKDKSYFDFSDMGTLVKYLLNTAGKDDFTLSATINLSILGDINMKGYVHIQDDEEGNEKVYAKVVMSDIPYIIGICEEIWSSRTATIYFTDDEIYMDVSIIYNGFLGIGKKNISKHMRVTLSDFGDNIVNYLLNYCIGIDTDKLSSFTKINNHVIDLSKILKSYEYNASTPSWTLTLDMEEISGTAALGDLDVTISGDKSNELLKKATGEMSLIGLLQVSFDGSVTSYKYIGDEMFGSITNYITSHQNDVLGRNYEKGR